MITARFAKAKLRPGLQSSVFPAARERPVHPKPLLVPLPVCISRDTQLAGPFEATLPSNLRVPRRKTAAPRSFSEGARRDHAGDTWRKKLRFQNHDHGVPAHGTGIIASETGNYFFADQGIFRAEQGNSSR
jgi:hypothetical protein